MRTPTASNANAEQVEQLLPVRNIPTARADLVDFLNAIGNVHADRINPAFKSRYASLPEVLDSVKSVAKLYNLAPHQRLGREPGHVVVITEIIHKDGTTFPAGEVAFKSETLTPQQLASATTYLRRLCLKTAVGIETDVDDDGAAASKPVPYTPSAPSTLSPGIRPLTK